MPGLDRLTASELLSRQSGEVGWPMDIGVVAVLDGGALVGPGGRVRVEVVRAAVRRGVRRVPRFRRVLHTPPRLLGAPVWVDVARVDLARHVRVAEPLAPPGGDAQLMAAVEELRRRPLEPDRPLWAMWLLPGLAGGRVAMYLRADHVVADGVGGVALLGALLDGRDVREAAPVPHGRPSTADLLRDQLRRAAAVRVRRGRGTARGLAEVAALRRVPPTSLDRVVGPGRRLEVVRGDLGRVRAAAHAHGATVNDVLLAAVAGGLRALLRSRGEDVRDLYPRAYEPVTLFLRRGPGARGDEQGMLFVPLPVGVADAAGRLRAVAAASAARKRHVVPAPTGGLTRSRPVRALMLRYAARMRWADVYVANVPGPTAPLSLAGAAVHELFPVVPLAGRTPLGVGVLSYAGRLGITVVADRDACPDVAVFTAGLRAELAALTASGSPAPPASAATGR